MGIIVQGIEYCSVRVLFSELLFLGASGLFFSVFVLRIINISHDGSVVSI